jgi:hypothetical protein
VYGFHSLPQCANQKHFPTYIQKTLANAKKKKVAKKGGRSKNSQEIRSITHVHLPPCFLVVFVLPLSKSLAKEKNFLRSKNVGWALLAKIFGVFGGVGAGACNATGYF